MERSHIIMLVEDNPSDEELTLRALKKNNVMNEIVVARDGVEALEYLFGEGSYEGRDTRVQPDVVLLDLKLPKLGGFEVLKNMRTDPRTEHIPVVVLTSSNQDEDIINSYELGANSFVRKPVRFDEFSQAVNQLEIYWLLVNEAPRPR